MTIVGICSGELLEVVWSEHLFDSLKLPQCEPGAVVDLLSYWGKRCKLVDVYLSYPSAVLEASGVALDLPPDAVLPAIGCELSTIIKAWLDLHPFNDSGADELNGNYLIDRILGVCVSHDDVSRFVSLQCGQ